MKRYQDDTVKGVVQFHPTQCGEEFEPVSEFGDQEPTIYGKFIELKNEIDINQADHLDTYRVFKEKDRKVRGRIRDLEVQNEVQELENSTLYAYIDDLQKRIAALEGNVQWQATTATSAVQAPSAPSLGLSDHVELINELVFGAAYDKINLGTLRALAKRGLVTKTVEAFL